MGAALRASRVGLVVVFLTAGVAELCDRAGARQAVAEFGLEDRLAKPVGVILLVLQIAVGVALIPLLSARLPAIGAAALLLCFSAAIAHAVARAPDVTASCTPRLPAGRRLSATSACARVAGDAGARRGRTPMAVLVEHGTISSGVAAGATAVLALIDAASDRDPVPTGGPNGRSSGS